MKLRAGSYLLMSFALVTGIFWHADAFAEDKSKQEEQIKRGGYLVEYGGCHDCHSPKVMTPQGPQPDPDRLLSGHPADSKLPELPEGILGPDKWGAVTNNDLTAWFGPWGVSFAANLTPDKQTGMGNWTPELFIKACVPANISARGGTSFRQCHGLRLRR